MTRAALALALLPIASWAAPAQALTPDELWGRWQADLAGLGALLGAPGAALSAEESRGPDGALTLRALTVSEPGLPPATLPPAFPIQAVTLRPMADGSVLVDLGIPPGGLVVADAGGELRIDEDGLAIVARDDPAGVAYEVAADTLRVAVHLPDQYGYGVPPTDVAVEVPGLRLRVPGQLGPGGEGAMEMAAGGYAYVASGPDPFTGTLGTQAARVEGDLSLSASATLPPSLFAPGASFEMTALRALRDGFAARMDIVAGTTATEQWVEGAPFPYQASATSEPSSTFLSVDAAAIAAGVEAESGTVSVTSPLLPFPRLDVTYGPVALELRLPLGPEPGDFSYRTSIEGLAVNDEAWAALDPEGRLGRDPFHLAVEATGRGTLNAEASLAAAAKYQPAPPPAFESVDGRAELSGAGLAATGTASFTFDAGTGTPVAAGTGSARVEGLDRLIDALVAFGAITEADARDARLGLATVFRAGDAPDVRVLAFEARPDGTLLLNGAPVPF